MLKVKVQWEIRIRHGLFQAFRGLKQALLFEATLFEQIRRVLSALGQTCFLVAQLVYVHVRIECVFAHHEMIRQIYDRIVIYNVCRLGLAFRQVHTLLSRRRIGRIRCQRRILKYWRVVWWYGSGGNTRLTCFLWQFCMICFGLMRSKQVWRTCRRNERRFVQVTHRRMKRIESGAWCHLCWLIYEPGLLWWRRQRRRRRAHKWQTITLWLQLHGCGFQARVRYDLNYLVEISAKRIQAISTPLQRHVQVACQLFELLLSVDFLFEQGRMQAQIVKRRREKLFVQYVGVFFAQILNELIGIEAVAHVEEQSNGPFQIAPCNVIVVQLF